MSDHRSRPDDLSPELREDLDCWQPPAAREGFREELRRAFVSGEAMAPVHEGLELERELGQVLDTFGKVPEARAEFREQLATEFTTATASSSAEEPVARRATRRRTPRRSSTRTRRNEAPASSSWKVLAGGFVTAAAAGLLFLLGVFDSSPAAEPGARWRMDGGAVALSEVTVDGASLAGLTPEEIADRLVGANLVSTGATRARFVLDRVVVVELGPESRVGLPDAALWSTNPSLTFAGEQGHLLFATGPDFPGGHLAVRTGEAEVEAIGTIFGVDIYPEGTCVCCTEGKVSVRSLVAPVVTSKSPDEKVAAQGRGFVTAADGVIHMGDISADHRSPLVELGDSLTRLW